MWPAGLLFVLTRLAYLKNVQQSRIRSGTTAVSQTNRPNQGLGPGVEEVHSAATDHRLP